VVLLAVVAPARAREGGDAEPTFFDPVVTLAPGISRELDFLLDHARAGNERLTSVSVKLQYPGLSWLQFSLEMPVLIRHLDPGDSATGAGDLVLAGEVAVLKARHGKIQLDVGVELTLPTGSTSNLAGSTALEPFARGAVDRGGRIVGGRNQGRPARPDRDPEPSVAGGGAGLGRPALPGQRRPRLPAGLGHAVRGAELDPARARNG